MNSFKTVGLIAALLCGAIEAQAIPLRVLSYNIWGLPSPIGKAPWRYLEIAKRLEKYDVIAIQEAWDPQTDILWKLRRSHPYLAFGRKPHGLFGASGIMILSRFPITKVARLTYSDCRFTDCLENKGAVGARIEITPEVEVDVYTTHLNAHAQYAAARSIQIAELARFVNEFSAGRALILAGDFNADFQTPNYLELKNGLNLQDSYDAFTAGLSDPSLEQTIGATYDGEHNGWVTGDKGRFERLDYIFSRDSQDVRLAVKDSRVCFKETIRSDRGDFPLSDHYGLTTLFEIESSAPTRTLASTPQKPQ